jgi:hypothetical protein
MLVIKGARPVDFQVNAEATPDPPPAHGTRPGRWVNDNRGACRDGGCPAGSAEEREIHYDETPLLEPRRYTVAASVRFETPSFR